MCDTSVRSVPIATFHLDEIPGRIYVEGFGEHRIAKLSELRATELEDEPSESVIPQEQPPAASAQSSDGAARIGLNAEVALDVLPNRREPGNRGFELPTDKRQVGDEALDLPGGVGAVDVE